MNKLPSWLRQEVPDMEIIRDRLRSFEDLNIHTVCEDAHCPNISDCFKRNTATFMILGNICTRDCRFCAVTKGIPLKLNSGEPQNVALAVKNLGLKHVVVTSVARDDLIDGGAGQFFDTVREIKKLISDNKIEVLIPDFQGSIDSLKKVINSGCDVIAHNIETVSNLYKLIRPKADYSRSLQVLENIKKIDNSIITKSGIMLGLGERYFEVIELLENLRSIDCDILTIGQYLAPSDKHAQVDRFVLPEEFQDLENLALSLGFKSVSSAPLVRSSFHSEELLEKCVM